MQSIKKGNKYKCIHWSSFVGQTKFIVGKVYTSPEDNYLTPENGPMFCINGHTDYRKDFELFQEQQQQNNAYAIY